MFLAKNDPDALEKRASGYAAWWPRFTKWIVPKKWGRPVALVLITFGTIGMWQEISPFLQGTTQTDQKFKGISDIGKALAPSGVSVIYEEAHEHALVVWVAAIGTHFVLFPNGSVLKQIDTDWDVSKWNDPNFVRKQLKLDPSCLPPLGGVARDWSNDPEKWKPIGCRTWNCDAASLFQQFKGGEIVGPIGYGQTDQEPLAINSRMIVILNNGIWRNEPSPVSASSCTASKI